MRTGNKYGARRTVFMGETFDSKAEVDFAWTLEMKKRAGDIVAWRRGERVTLIDGPTAMERVTYRPDFIVMEIAPDETAYDMKGRYRLPPDVRIKALLWRQKFPAVPLVFIDARGQRMDLFKRKTSVRRRAA